MRTERAFRLRVGIVLGGLVIGGGFLSFAVHERAMPPEPPRIAAAPEMLPALVPSQRSAEASSPQGLDPTRATSVPWTVRLRGLVGILVMLGIAFWLSNSPREVSRRVLLWGMGLQIALALLILRTSPGRWFFERLGELIRRLLSFAVEGATFVFGPLAGESLGTIFAFRVLPTIIFVSSFFSILYYLGVMQRIVLGMAKFMAWTMKVSGAESLAAAANVFMGQTEAPLIIAPYVASMTRSELLCLMLGGMATIAGGVMAAYIGMGINPVYLLTGSVMAAPAAIMMSKILIPEKEEPLTRGVVRIEVKTEDRNVIEAAARGASDGARLAINVAAMLIAFIALIALVNALLGFVHARLSFVPPNLQGILGYLFAPLALVMGVPTADVTTVGNLLGQKLILNEFVAYVELARIQAELDPRSTMIATYALCGFANFASIGIQIGGIGGIAPNRRGDLAELGLRAMIGGFLTTCLTGTIAGLIS